MSLFTTKALAADSSVPCTYLAQGCDVSSDGILRIITVTGDALVTVIGAICVLFVIIGGMQMSFGGGDDGKIAKGRETALYAAGGLVIAMLSQTIIKYFVLRGEEIRDGPDGNFVLNAIAIAIEQLLLIFNVGITIVIVLAGFRYLFSRGADDKAQGALKMVVWAIAGGILVNMARIIAEYVINIVT